MMKNWAVPVLAALMVVCLGAVKILSWTSTVMIPQPSPSIKTILSVDWSRWENCSIPSLPSLQQTSSGTTKPIWMANFPDSGAGAPSGEFDIWKSIINALTNYPHAAKSYYAKSSNTRKCRSNTEPTVTCHTLHPVVGDGSIERTHQEFYTTALFAIRAPQTVIPAHFQDKAIKYHGQVGQVSEESWRLFRDAYFQDSVGVWQNVIRVWKQLPYKLVYLPYEQLMDPMDGPLLLGKTSQVLQEAGFAVVSSDYYDCLWAQTIRPHIARHRNYTSDYIPGYTTVQLQWLRSTLHEFQTEMANDTELVALLQEYVDLVPQTRIDE